MAAVASPVDRFDARCICLRTTMALLGQDGGGQARAPAHRWAGQHWLVWPELVDCTRPALLEISTNIY